MGAGRHWEIGPRHLRCASRHPLLDKRRARLGRDVYRTTAGGACSGKLLMMASLPLSRLASFGSSRAGYASTMLWDSETQSSYKGVQDEQLSGHGSGGKHELYVPGR